MTRRVVICAAVSTADKNQDPESQVKPLQAVCDRFGWTVVEVLRFKQSRFDPESEKEVQDAALAPIRDGRADTLAVWAWDRISRGDGEQAFSFIGRLEKHLGGSFYSLQEPFLCTASDPEVRKLLLPIIAWVANLESGRKSKRMVAKAANKREVANRVGQRALWGRGKMPTDDDRRIIHDLRAEGLSMRAIKDRVGLGLATVHAVLAGPRPDGAAVRPAADEQASGPSDAGAPGGGVGFEHGSGPDLAGTVVPNAPNVASAGGSSGEPRMGGDEPATAGQVLAGDRRDQELGTGSGPSSSTPSAAAGRRRRRPASDGSSSGASA